MHLNIELFGLDYIQSRKLYILLRHYRKMVLPLDNTCDLLKRTVHMNHIGILHIDGPPVFVRP